MFLRKAVSKDLLTSIFEQPFRVLVGLGGPQIRFSGGVFLGLPAALWRSWAGLWRRGRFLSDVGCHLGPIFGVQNRPWNAPRAKRRPILPSWRVPGRVPEGLWEVILGTFWRLGWRERKKGTTSTHKHRFVKLFLHAFSYRFRVYSNSKKCLKPLVFAVESAYAQFARAARQSFKANESRTK